MAFKHSVALEGVIVNVEGEVATTWVFEALAAPHAPPIVVSVRVAVPVNPPGGVHVAFKVFAFGENVPPVGVDHVPPVAEPPTDPPNGSEEPPPHIGLSAAPAVAIGAEFIVNNPSNDVALPLELVNTAR